MFISKYISKLNWFIEKIDMNYLQYKQIDTFYNRNDGRFIFKGYFQNISSVLEEISKNSNIKMGNLLLKTKS